MISLWVMNPIASLQINLAKNTFLITSAHENYMKNGNDFNFVQLSKGYLEQMRSLTRKSPLAQEILFYLVEHMGRTTNAVVCSYITLQEATGMGRSSVGKAIKLLKSENWIEAVRIGSTTAYAVNPRVFRPA